MIDKLYIAGKFKDDTRERLREIRTQIRKYGIKVDCNWLDIKEDGAIVKDEAKRDLADVASSAMMIIDTFDESTTGGREVEMGYAMALHKPVWVVGLERNIFHTLANRYFVNWDKVLEELRAIQH